MSIMKREMMKNNKKIHHKQVHYQLLQSLIEGPPAANVREKLAHLDHALSLPCTDGGNRQHDGNDRMPNPNEAGRVMEDLDLFQVVQ